MKKLMMAFLSLVAFSACDGKGPKEGTIERASAEQQAARKVEDEHLAHKAERMEADLSLRHSFYDALEGKYEGTVMVDRQAYRMRLVLARSLPQYKGGRTRQLSEIESDLNNLFFHVQVVQWHPEDPATAVGCRITGIRPDMNLGVLTLTSTDCPNAYRILLSQQGGSRGRRTEAVAQELADRVRAGELKLIDNLIGTIQPTWNARTFTFDIKHVQ